MTQAKSEHHRILSLEVTGGFLQGVKLEFADGLNCIIGGRGTGKTTVLELIRYVLGLVPDQKKSPAMAKAINNLVQGNLRNGRIRLKVETKHGMRYLAERPWNDTCQVFNEQGEATAISLDRDLIFKADVYSQNEIEEIATNPSFQLALIDKFIEEEVRGIDAEIRKLVAEVDQNANELRRLDRETRDLGDTTSELAALEEKLKAFQEAGGTDAAAVNKAHAHKALREKEKKALQLLRTDISRVGQELDSAIASAASRINARIDNDLLTGPNQTVFEAVARHVQAFTTMIEGVAAKIQEQARAADTALAAEVQQLETLHAKQEAEYRALVTQSEEERGRAVERTRLQQRYVEVTTARQELDARQKERRAAEDRRRELTSQLSALRDKRFQLRKQVADKLTAELQPTVRVTVTQAGDRQSYRDMLTEALKGTGMKYGAVVDKVVQTLSPDELAVLIQRSDHDRLADRAGLDADRAKRVIEALRGDLVYQLDVVELEDLPRIELLDGRDYKDSSDLSTGQRCTTILPILLLESERPLLIDQPEDNLDNAFIYDTVVKSLEGTKGNRQLIFVTHNPNIPVLGDAKRVFVLASDGKRGSVDGAGTVDELKEKIETLLEGGREAFLLRKKRYGH